MGLAVAIAIPIAPYNLQVAFKKVLSGRFLHFLSTSCPLNSECRTFAFLAERATNKKKKEKKKKDRMK